MHFTREPILETIISPKDGYKLVLRHSSGSSNEEFVVDAVEVVSFGKSYFFRSIERPKAFILPVSEYEVVETRETRVPLKKATSQKAVKIAGGKEEAPKEKKKRSRKKKQEVVEEEPAVQTAPTTRIIEPPTSLISDQIRQYKQENPQPEEDLFSEQDVEEAPPPAEEPAPTQEEEKEEVPTDFPF